MIIYTFLLVFSFMISAGCNNAPAETNISPESIFNMATDEMMNGNDALAIDLYYKLVDYYPDFSKYRADSMFRLGTLLYKTERYDEAEKIFGLFADTYGNDSRLKMVYEKLLYIYMQEFHDEERAQIIRNLYANKFKKSEVLSEIDRTINVLSMDDTIGSAVLAMDASEISIIQTLKMEEIDKELFPVRNYILKSVKSPDGKYMVEKKEDKGNNYLYFGASEMNTLKIGGSLGGYAPQWSWNSRYIVFTSMNWQKKERKILIYDLKERVIRKLFTGKGVGPLLCISPDSTKIVFSCSNKLWIMKINGDKATLLSSTVNAKNIRMIAWSREGGSIIFSKKNEYNRYYFCKLGKKDSAI